MALSFLPVSSGPISATAAAGSSGVTSYTLTADSGSITLTGGAANLLRGRRLVADGATITLTGTAANLKVGRKLLAASDSIIVTGGAASLIRGRRLVADGGSVVITATAAGLTRTRRLTADAGSITVTGSDATLTYSGGAAVRPPEVGGSWVWVDAKPRRELKHYTLDARGGLIWISPGVATMTVGVSKQLQRRRRCEAALLLAA